MSAKLSMRNYPSVDQEKTIMSKGIFSISMRMPNTKTPFGIYDTAQDSCSKFPVDIDAFAEAL